METFFDTHAHIGFPDFEEDLADVIARARGAGVVRVNCVGTDFESSRRAIALAERYEGVFAVVGWHPGHASEAPGDVRQPLRELAAHPKVVAIGETGLDYFRLPNDASQAARIKEKQAALFHQQLEVAVELGLNAVVHQRACMEDTLAQFEPFAGRTRAVFHCFVDDAAVMRRVMDLNSLVSFTGILTFKNAQSVRDTLAATPSDRFMLETDCPYLAPTPFRGKRCEPAHVRQIAEIAAEARGCSLVELSRLTCATAKEFFHRMPG